MMGSKPKRLVARGKISSLDIGRKADVINRLKTVRGVTDGTKKDVYCVDVLKQIRRRGRVSIASHALCSKTTSRIASSTRSGREILTRRSPS